MLLESFACLCIYGRVLSKLATGFFVMGLTRSWWEIPRAHLGWVKDERSCRGGGGVGAPTGALSHDDIVKQIRQGLLVATHTFVSGHPSMFRYWTKPTQGFGEPAPCAMGNRAVWQQGLVWVCVRLFRMDGTDLSRPRTEESSSSISKIK